MKLFWILFLVIHLCFSQQTEGNGVNQSSDDSSDQNQNPVTNTNGSSDDSSDQNQNPVINTNGSSDDSSDQNPVTNTNGSSDDSSYQPENTQKPETSKQETSSDDSKQQSTTPIIPPGTQPPATTPTNSGSPDASKKCKESVGDNCISCNEGEYLTKIMENGYPVIVCRGPDFTTGTSNDKDCQTNDGNICTSCKEGYRLVNNKCEKCPDGCEKCNTDICYKCSGTLSLSLDRKQCIDCSNAANDELCGRCGSGKYFDDVTMKCVSCKSNCALCKSNTDCYQCENYHYLDNNECKLIENCAVSKIDHCEECNSGYRLQKGACVKCSDNCLQCSSDNKCMKCADKYILSPEGTCIKVENAQTTLNCAEGSSIYGCTKCKDGYFFNNEKKCQECDKSCKTCVGTATTCLSCPDNYYFDESGLVCKPKQQDCAYSDQFGCKECIYDVRSTEPGKLVEEGKKECTSCNKNCKTCQGQNTNCTSCFKDNILSCTKTSNGYRTCTCSAFKTTQLTSHCLRSEMGYCVQCEDGYYVGGEEESTRSCKECPSSCYTCSDSKTCLICANGYYRDAETGNCKNANELSSKCVVGQDGCLICTGRFFMNTSQTNPTCQECPAECKECIYDNKKNKAVCTVCVSEKEYVKDGECKPCGEMKHCSQAYGDKCTACESGYTLDPGAKSCSQTNWAVIIPVDIVICIIIIILVVLLMIFIWWRRQKSIKKKREAMKNEMVTTDMAVILAQESNDDFPLKPETWNLTFNLNGSQAVVDSLYEEKVNIQNTSKKDQWFEILVEKSHKYEITITPPSCLLKPGSSIDIDFKLRMLCTTEIDEFIGIVALDVDDQQKSTAKFTLKVKSDQSHSLDYKDLKPNMPSIGETLSGILYRGTYQGKDVCIHKLRIKKFTEIQEKLFNAEITMMGELKDDHIVTLIGAVYTPGEIAIVTEYPEYNSLNSLWGKQHVLYATKIKMMKEVAKGLAYLHKNQILHRDISSTNIHVFSINPEEDICCKVAGLKYAKNMKGAKEMTKGIGSPIYMAPEVIKNEGKYSYPSDVYSFAILMYETFVEYSPYESDQRFTQEWMVPQFVLNGNRLDKHRQMPDNYWNLIMSSWVEKESERPDFNTIISTIDGWKDVDDIVLEDHEVESGDRYGVNTDGHVADEKVHSDSSSGSDYDTSNSSSSSSSD